MSFPQDLEASEKSAANAVKGFRERMRNQLHINKDAGKDEEDVEAAAQAREEAMRTIVVPGKQDIGNVLLDITYFPFECVDDQRGLTNSLLTMFWS